MIPRSFKRPSLTAAIFTAIILALACAIALPVFSQSLSTGGEIFLRLLKMIVVPLVCTSVLSGLLGMGDVRKLGKPGLVAIGYYLLTTLVAAVIGLAVVNLIQPGVDAVEESQMRMAGTGADASAVRMSNSLQELTALPRSEVETLFPQLSSEAGSPAGFGMIVENLLLMVVPENLFLAASKTQLLPLVVFCLFFGALLTTMGDGAAIIVPLVHQLNAALMKAVGLIMMVAPVGIFCLVASRFGKAVADGNLATELSQVSGYVLAVAIGLTIHALIVLPLLYWLIVRRNPYRYLVVMLKALLTAFSTSSSSATLPVTLGCIEEAGVSKRSAQFAAPIGATINMDGTALYEAVAAMFIAQVAGFDLSLGQQMVVVVGATLAAIGAAGIPEGGLVTMIIVLNAVGLPVELIGLILSVDWLLDRLRTVVNVLGDGIAAAVVDQVMPSSSASCKVLTQDAVTTD
ncbi:dicarboxylate/amino acid:cation symporter [Rhodopirellula sp.]|nr:dicarboxylate/amino acid:cation symporter [Rhodopirellula sp.]MDB4678977.1 dicarboxylate/amino acid:cation symporter [Rhodopirellula sp.]